MAKDTFSNFKDGVITRADQIYKNHSVRYTYHPIWAQAMAFYEGEQWKIWSKVDKKLRDFAPATLDRRLVINKVQSIITTFVAHFMRELPTFYVNPNSNTPEDVNAADMSQNILQVEYSGKLEESLPEYFYWKYIIGTGVRGLFWDPKASAEIKMPQYDENNQLTGEKVITVPDIGQLYIKTINPFNFYPVGGSTIGDCTEIVYVEALPLEVIDERFDFEATEENIDSNIVVSGYKRDYDEDHKESFEKKAKVMYYWKRDCSGFNDGLYAVIINGKRVEYRDNPYLQYGCKYPFSKSCAIPVPGQFWGKSPVEQVRRIQIAYNYVYSILIQTLERMGKLKWWMPKGADVDPTTMSSKIGEITYYNPSPNAPPPTQANLSPIPYYYFQVLEWLDKAFEDVTGFHEVKSARLPTGANNPSGVMVNLLLEQDESRLTPAIKQYLTSLKTEAKLYLKMVQDLYVESRILKITGAEKDSEILDFRGATLRDNDDVNVEIAPVLSESRAAWEGTVFKALELQLIDGRTAIQKLKLEHPKALLNIMADERAALRENTLMRKGNAREIAEWDEDNIHLNIHEQFMKTATFEKLPADIQAIFYQHREKTVEQQQQKVQEQMQTQMQQQQQQMQTQMEQQMQIQQQQNQSQMQLEQQQAQLDMRQKQAEAELQLQTERGEVPIDLEREAGEQALQLQADLRRMAVEQRYQRNAPKERKR